MTSFRIKKQTANTVEIVATIAGTDFRTVCNKEEFYDFTEKLFNEALEN